MDRLLGGRDLAAVLFRDSLRGRLRFRQLQTVFEVLRFLVYLGRNPPGCGFHGDQLGFEGFRNGPLLAGPATTAAMPAASGPRFFAAAVWTLPTAAIRSPSGRLDRLLGRRPDFGLLARRPAPYLSRSRLAGSSAAPSSLGLPAALLFGARTPSFKPAGPLRRDFRHQLRGGFQGRKGRLALFRGLLFARWRPGWNWLGFRGNRDAQLLGQSPPVLRSPSDRRVGRPRGRLSPRGGVGPRSLGRGVGLAILTLFLVGRLLYRGAWLQRFGRM